VDGANRARLTDFGLAVVIHATMTSISTGGSLRWTAPELLDPERYMTDIEEKNRGRATKQSDMYALAITTWEVRFCSCGYWMSYLAHHI
jgi:serine/threonine protein kinase